MNQDGGVRYDPVGTPTVLPARHWTTPWYRYLSTRGGCRWLRQYRYNNRIWYRIFDCSSGGLTMTREVSM